MKREHLISDAAITLGVDEQTLIQLVSAYQTGQPLPTKDGSTPDAQTRARQDIGRLIGSLDDEAFSWLVMTITGMGRPPIWPDGLGGFRDRNTIEKVRAACQAYVASMQ